MRKKLLFIMLVAAGICAQAKADLLSEILTNKWAAKTVKTRVTDSILNVGNDEPAPRWSLTYENKQKRFRRSFEADYFIVDSQKKTRTHLSDTIVRDAVLSPNGRYIAFIKGNNLYVHKLDYGTEVAVTTNEDPDILNGVADWLYEEEFGCTHLFEWAPDSKTLAFVRLDEHAVPTFTWQEMLDSVSTYPVNRSLRYPRAGEANAKATVCLYDLQYKDIKTIEVGEVEYIPRLHWNGDQLMIQKLNRDQNKMEILSCNPKSTVCKLWYKENCNDGWVDYADFDEWQWLSNGNVVVVNSKSGWRQAYLYSKQGKQLQQLTEEGRDLMKVYGYDEKEKTLYGLISTEIGTQVLGGIGYNADKKTGMHTLYFSKDLKRMIDRYEDTETPYHYTMYEKSRKEWKEVEVEELAAVNHKNEQLAERWQALGLNNMEFFTFTTERGDAINGWMILPPEFDETQKYPVIMLQYSGPDSQRVLDRWKKNWEHALGEMGYIVVCVDGRGTGGRGCEWRFATYMRLGQKEAEDLISAAHWLQQMPYVDGSRMCIGGWSYGGFEALMTMSQSNSPFRCGFAIAPVTDYRLYDSGYTERFMRRPQVNDLGYAGSDLTAMAGKLKGNLLLIHGLADDNVHCQNTWRYVEALVQAGKQFEMQIYPDDNHSLRKPANREHMHRRLVQFLENNLQQ